MNLRRRAALVLLAALSILAFPAAASAVTYTVNSTGSEEDKSLDGTCETNAVGKCTLRAAIEESNESGVEDEILFSALFDGEKADSTIANPFMPAITDTVTIDGDAAGQCETDANVEGPCVGLAGSYGLTVQAPKVKIEGLAISDAQIGIAVEDEEFEARGDWLGFELDGTDGEGEQPYGIFVVGPGADKAVIGGTTAAERNVFGNTNSGLVLRGSSFGTVLGNYFGVEPDGTTAASNGRDLVVANKLEIGNEVDATDNQIGTNVGAEGTATAACDHGCNVFASKSGFLNAAIDLVGNELAENEGPATGPTDIDGNYIGLGADGEEVENDATFGINVGSSDGVEIGGEENGEANYFAGDGTAVYHQDGKDFALVGNVIGDGPTSADVQAPTLGLFVYCLELGTESAEAVTVSANVFDMDGGKAIESVFGDAEIEANFIEGAETGIFTRGDPAGAGNLIKDNVIGESSVNGILIESDLNSVLHNAIYGSGAAGVRVQDPEGSPLVITTKNLIGGSSAAEENTIRESGDDAIQIVDVSGNTEEDSYNQVGRNKGDSNEGRFISLIGNANAGIEPPVFTAQSTSASGSGAEPNATIRVFRKKTSSLGEIESFLAEVEADEAGSWEATYSAIPGETIVAASQTSVLGGTSELETAKTPPDPPSGGGGGGGGGNTGGGGNNNGGNKGGKKDTTPPDTKITKGPAKKTHKRKVTFKFTSTEGKSTFQCKLDKKPFKACGSPKTYKKLKPGKHVFKVRAIDKAGNVDPTPAKRKFTVLR